jgi:hypothetical protein
MKKLAFAVILVASFLSVRSASATSIWYTIPGSSCVIISPTDPGRPPVHANWGVGNAAAGFDVTCPVVLPYQAYTTTEMRVNGYNRSTTDAVSCTLLATDYAGANPIPMSLSLPFDGSNTMHSVINSAQNIGAFVNQPAAPLLSLTCHVPGNTSAGASWLTAIFVLASF